MLPSISEIRLHMLYMLHVCMCMCIYIQISISIYIYTSIYIIYIYIFSCLIDILYLLYFIVIKIG